MELILSSKGQIVLPAPLRRRLRLKPRARFEAVERDGGIFLRPINPATTEPIDYAPIGSLKANKRMRELDRLAGPDAGPDQA